MVLSCLRKQEESPTMFLSIWCKIKDNSLFQQSLISALWMFCVVWYCRCWWRFESLADQHNWECTQTFPGKKLKSRLISYLLKACLFVIFGWTATAGLVPWMQMSVTDLLTEWWNYTIGRLAECYNFLISCFPLKMALTQQNANGSYDIMNVLVSTLCHLATFSEFSIRL